MKEGYAPVPTPAPLPPPAYVPPPILAIASALYSYSPTDAGDLALSQGDRIQVLEHMNNDCVFHPHQYVTTC
jgi:LAS seventeen-binding protein 1/2